MPLTVTASCGSSGDAIHKHAHRDIRGYVNHTYRHMRDSVDHTYRHMRGSVDHTYRHVQVP